jgi:penicillin-binding protein 2
MTILQDFSYPFERKEIERQKTAYKYKSIFIMFFVTAFLFGGIGSRLAYLQLVKGEEFGELADNNRIRLIPKAPIRGNIYDRKGRVLATTRFSYSAFVWPIAQKKATWPQTSRLLAKILGIPEAEIRQKVEQEGYDSPTLIRIARNLAPAQMTAIEEYRNYLDGVEMDVDPIRYYPQGELGAHILGYTGEISPNKLKQLRPEGYRLGDIIGKMGVEFSYEKQLRGEWGGQQVEVNGAGKVVRVLGQKPPQAGEDVTLSVDLDLQKTAAKALGERKGAIVALDPRNGAVLAMVSNPSFDPNMFSSEIKPDIWEKLRKKGDPFVNRALRGFPPASTFKVVTATAGMESGKFSPNVILPTYAYLSVAGIRMGEWNHAGFGPIGFVRAMAMSSNTFHGQIGKGVGGPTLIDWSRRYGFGQKTGIELEEDIPGLIADDAWKKKWYKMEWNVGDTVNMSIGQGFTQATPLQVCIMFAVQANGGYRVKPHLLRDEKDPQKWLKSLNLKPTTLATVRKGLREVVANGTGKALNSPDLPPAAGKSGTAEAPPGKSHTWFGGFAPFDKPEIVVVAFAEHSGGGGGKVAAPMVRQVMETYFKNQKTGKSSR